MFNKKFDEVFGLTKEEPKVLDIVEALPQSPTPEVEEELFDPPAALDPEAIPNEKDPFTSELDQMLASEGVDVELEKRRRYNPTSGDMQAHDWETVREALYSDEKYQFRCKRCLQWVHVAREQTMVQAYEEQGIDPNCANKVITDIQTS